MKYIQFILLLFVIFSCQRLKDIEMSVENNTEYLLQIESFYNDQNLETILINPHSNYINYIKYSPEDGPERSIFKKTYIDSVNIIFNNERIIVQSCEDPFLESCFNIARNIMNLQEFEYEDLGKRSSRYSYIITQEDYNNAVPIKD